MSSTTVFAIGEFDYSDHVIAGTYKVNKLEEYKERRDGNHTEHRRFLRYRIEGEFEMFFRTLTEYKAFLADYTAAKTSSLTLAITVTPNNTDVPATIYAFVDFEPIRDIDWEWNDRMQQFTVTIREA